MGNRLLDGRYEIKKQLGNGGCATVYLCYDNKLHKNWAVKELTEAVNTERSMELEILKTVSCNAFPRIVDIVKEENRIFIMRIDSAALEALSIPMKIFFYFSSLFRRHLLL